MRLKYLPLAALLALIGCVPPPNTGEPTPPASAGLTPISLSALPGWADDNIADALTTFVRGCKAILVMPADTALGASNNGYIQQIAGQAGLWQPACNAAEAVPPNDDAAARTFFTNNFNAYQISNHALITGYFEPQYPGSKNLKPGFTVPLYAKPADPALASLSRADIDHGALNRKTPVTAYLADPVDAFMLQIQGSGRILLQNGTTLRVGFDGQNGQPYVPIGHIMVQQGDIPADQVSFQTISAWLKANPAQATGIMEQNTRYVFIKPLGPLPDNLGAPGSLGVPVTAGRSLAVDRADIPLGAPVFLSTTEPTSGNPLNRLTIAQDTGGGIHGTDAADLFFGSGPDAEASAGHMMQQGSLFILLPKSPTAPTS
ncbi:MAG: hypothetical protein B7Z75_04085 [Acidocella sp. 20-57-95]|nr:MAG: hypothetical protein B7Z75_04085 [Acidocella sp. 20-57-95]OYV57851.1 MAG: hypothetical protein B7Z71_11900 [Acidocella sp. 21-58-7]HQT63891.1 MltA domain-containing protein [Acidocella sp.]HQU05460.1 MltA domain-containing protein [Acidocella sp.]